ncbi:MAG: FAD-dependent oxidoreductase [Dehalococcoidales bacterium]|nr:FAD-dependent oxidoreductase [Dehalococcoidales bacterium]
MKQYQSDIAVLSAGTAGLAAAVTAAEGGASVIALEKTNHTGGTALRANQLFCVESKLQRIKQYSLTKEEAFRAYMDFMQWSVDARLIKTLIDMSTETMEWFEDMGVEFIDLTSHGPGGYYTAHIVKPDPPQPGLGGAAVMMRKLEEKARELGVQILLKTPAKKLIKENDRIIGVEAEDNEGETVRVNCKAVILATGGFGGHHRAPFGIPGLVGEGIRMAKEVGAEATEGTMPPPFGGEHSASAANLMNPVTASFGHPHLMVNLSGERFVNEEVTVTTPFGANAVSLQKDKRAFRIFDEDTKDYFIENGLEFPMGFGIAQAGTPSTMVNRDEFEAEITGILEKGSGMVIIADSIDELAEKTGIDKEGLKKTLDEYNRCCETGRDTLFNKKARYLRPVKRPRFYASRSMGSTGTPEGVKVNYKTEVLTNDFTVIPGLYAAGGDMVCNLYKDIYPNILPGNAMGFSLSTGRIAARSALEYIRTVNE